MFANVLGRSRRGLVGERFKSGRLPRKGTESTKFERERESYRVLRAIVRPAAARVSMKSGLIFLLMGLLSLPSHRHDVRRDEPRLVSLLEVIGHADHDDAFFEQECALEH